MLRRVVGAVVVAVALGAPGVAEAGVLKSLVKSVPVLSGPNALTPTCVSSGFGGSGWKTCTGAVPLYSCTSTSTSVGLSGSGCTLGVEDILAVHCGTGSDRSGPGTTSCRIDAAGTGVGCSQLDYPASSTRSCHVLPATTVFSCTSENGAPAKESPTCGPVARLVDGLLNP